MVNKRINTTGGLRIAFDAKRAFNNGTGLGNYARFVIKALIQYYPQHQYFLFTPTIKPEFADFYEASEHIHLVTPDSFLGKSFSSFWRTYAIAGICNELKIDVYHGLSNELPVGMEHFRGRKLVTVHDLIFLRYPDYYNNIDRYIYTRKFRNACNDADIIVAASNQTAADVQTYFQVAKEKIKTIYQNCDEVFEQNWSIADADPILESYKLKPNGYLLNVGTIESRKNQLTVLRAFHMANQEELKMVFVGKRTAYANELDAYIETHGLSHRVVFLEGIPHEHLPALYQHASVFIYASVFEGFGIPILEALRSRVPVLAANTSSLTEVGGHAALYFEPYDVESLVGQIRKVQEPAFRKELIEAGTQQATLFNTSVLATQMAELWK